MLQSTLSRFVPKYAKYKPRINLEILTARKADSMLVLTYFMFFACLAGIILMAIFLTNDSLETVLNPTCCSASPYTTNFTLNDPTDSFAFMMTAVQTNFTTLKNWKLGSQPGICFPVEVSFSSNIWDCLDSNGCNQFPSDVSSTASAASNVWQNVQFYSSVATTNMCALQSSNYFTITVIPQLYHVQVSNQYHLIVILVLF